MRIIKTAPATIILIALNTIVFAINYFSIGTFEEPYWTLGLLDAGALFNPYTLDDEWYRILSHMFMHGGIVHLIVNMYALYMLGSDVEASTGTKKFAIVYFISGIGAAIATLSISIFTVGVGASGAIFGMYGFALIYNITRSRESDIPLTPLFINFAVFLGINLLIAKAVHADNAAHFGGLITGLIIGLFSFITHTNYSKIRLEYILLPLFILIFFLLPRYQVQYFNFYQNLFDVEEQLNEQSHEKHTDPEFLKIYQANYERWDSTLQLLDSISYFPNSLQSDTARVRGYIQLAKKEYEFRIIMLEKESFIYLDSIQYVNEQMRELPRPEHVPYFRMPKESSQASQEDEPRPEPVKVLYDSNWIEIPDPPAIYYRIGTKDSLGNWDGKVTDYFANGDVQMRGGYKNGKRDGVFIYYSDHRTYLSAGRYRDNLSFGKWEYYHPNGKLESEVYYRNRYFLKNLWDSTGTQLVVDGKGVETHAYPNGVIALEGKYLDGYKEGYWYGRYENGEMYFEENFFNGRLVNGRSYNAKGDAFYYDESSFSPLPEGGFSNLRKYLAEQTATSQEEGVVRLSFQVTANGQLTDILIEKSASPELNARAKEILLQGPRWLPGKNHGQEPINNNSFVEMTFQKSIL